MDQLPMEKLRTANMIKYYGGAAFFPLITFVIFIYIVFNYFQNRELTAQRQTSTQVHPDYFVENKPIPTKYKNNYFDPPVVDDLCVRDFYIAGSYQSYQPCGATYDICSLKMIETVIEKGARALYLDIWSSNPNNVFDPSSEPIVRNNTLMPLFGNALLFNDVCNTISKHAWNGIKYPLILYLHFHPPAFNNKALLRKCAAYLLQYFKRRLLSPKYSYNRTKPGDIPMQEAMGKLIILTNEYPLESMLNEFINGVITEKNQEAGQYLVYTDDMEAHGGISSKHINTSDMIENNKMLLSIVLPEEYPNPSNVINPMVDLFNPDHKDSREHGFDICFMNYQLYDKNMRESIEFFKTGGFQLKPQELRYVPRPKVKIDKQNSKASYAPRNIQLYGDWFVHQY